MANAEAPRIISMDFSTAGRDDCYFRILTGATVKYVIIQAGALDAESLMNMPLDFENILPSLPYQKDDWNRAYISRNAESRQLETALSRIDLPAVETVWHLRTFNFLELERTQPLSLLSEECKWKRDPAGGDSQTMIAKMARFSWEVRYIEAETRMYQLLQPLGLTPSFLGHIHEEGRVIGFLLEKVEGRPAGGDDLSSCRSVLRRLHDRGILHGDCNRYNFIVGPRNTVTLIDFGNAKVNADAGLLEREAASLEEQLREETGRGAGFTRIE